jgi:uncharacterized protein (TIGR03643 family)
MTKKQVVIDEVTLGEVIDMALSDHVSFTAIEDLYGLTPDQVKTVMRANLRPARYRAWRGRVQTFGDRRAHYKRDTYRAEKIDPQFSLIEHGGDADGQDETGSDLEVAGPVNRKPKSVPKRALANP